MGYQHCKEESPPGSRSILFGSSIRPCPQLSDRSVGPLFGRQSIGPLVIQSGSPLGRYVGFVFNHPLCLSVCLSVGRSVLFSDTAFIRSVGRFRYAKRLVGRSVWRSVGLFVGISCIRSVGISVSRLVPCALRLVGPFIGMCLGSVDRPIHRSTVRPFCLERRGARNLSECPAQCHAGGLLYGRGSSCREAPCRKN